ncbi:hypothetical protein [Streptomyces xinghaiensis]|nr:hypothetical protein OG463_07700 [Streptomyces xinghaiensis]
MTSTHWPPCTRGTRPAEALGVYLRLAERSKEPTATAPTSI